MAWQNEIEREYTFGVSSGTTAITDFVIGEEDRLIAAETVTMLTWRLLPVRFEVSDSLDQSITNNADIWSELSNY